MSIAPSPAPLPAIDSSRIPPEALHVLQRLHERGHVAYLAGGCVRDLLTGRTPRDFDVVSSATPLEVRALFPQSVGFGGRRFLVVQVRFEGGKSIEVAPFRAQPSTDHSGPDATVIPDERLAEFLPERGTPEQDARARDFTVNGLFLDGVSGQVIDHVQGLRDLQANLLRPYGDPEARLREDPGIMLRGARFATRLGMEFEPRTAEAMVRMGGEMARCQRFRLLSETLRGLGAGTGAPFLRLLQSMGWLPLLLPPVARRLAEGGPALERRFFAQVEVVDRSIASGQRYNELMLACALLLPLTSAEDALPPPEALVALLGELVQGAPELAALPKHAHLLVATLHQVMASPEAAPPGNPLLPDARRLASLVTEARRGPPTPTSETKPLTQKESDVAGEMDIAAKVSSLAARVQELLKASGPEANPAVVSWVRDVESTLPHLTPGAVAKLGPHAASVDNLRLNARTVMQSLLRAAWLDTEARTALSGFLERNPAAREVGKYRFSSDWMSKCEEDWRKLLAPLVGVPGVRALEIGSFEGRSAVWLLENVLTHPTSGITCVDPFEGEYSRLFDANIAASGAANRVEKKVGYSFQALRVLAPEPTYDFIYVDGSHLAFDVLQDAVLSWPMLKPGGWMIFDDYGMASARLVPGGSGSRPDIGIDAFLSAAEGRFELVSKGFQLTIRKKQA